jgi:hypothetical protein
MLDSHARALAERLVQKLGAMPLPKKPRGDVPARVLVAFLESRGRRGDAVAKSFRKDHAGVRTSADLRALIERCGGPRNYLVQIVRIRGIRRAHVLVALLDYLIEVQRQYRGRTESQRLRAWARSMRPGDFSSLGIEGFRLQDFQRLRAALGANAAPPDRAVARDVSRLLDVPVGTVQGLYLLERAAKFGGFDVTDIDERLFRHWQSTQRPARPSDP